METVLHSAENLGPPGKRYRPITASTIVKRKEWKRLDRDLRETIQVVAQVLPFRTNEYVVENMIDWNVVPDDPIYQLTFPQREMLDRSDYRAIQCKLASGADRAEVKALANRVRLALNPHPAGQMSHNVPRLNGRPLPGLQHKYRETVLYFPAQGQTCHAYCTYCFRWAQFVGMSGMKFQAREVHDLRAYLRAHPEVSDVLFTGGDPLIMKTEMLRRHVEPLLDPKLGSLRHVRIGTKALAYWPQRVVTDPDADDLLRLFERIVQSGRHLSIMAHYSHPVELAADVAREAVRRIRGTGAEIRMQAPVIRHVNDDPRAWAQLWRRGVSLGMVPYYMFVERDTGPKEYFKLPLVRAYEIFQRAYTQVSGLARTVRGPSMSAFPGKIRVLGTPLIEGRRVFALDMLQARDPELARHPFFADFDDEASWIDELRPAFASSFPFEMDEQVEGVA